MTTHSRRARLWPALLALAMASGAALAQKPPEPKPGPAPASPAPRDAQAKYEPPSGPGAGQQFLKTFEGEWTGRAQLQSAQRRPSEQGDRRVHAEDGAGRPVPRVRLHIPPGRQDHDWQRHQRLRRADRLFTTFWYDSRSTRFSIRQSREPFDGKQIVLHSASLTASHGQERQSRTVSHLEDGGNKLIHQQFHQDAGGKEKLLMELILTRKPKK